jgi:DNA modification methylase
VARVLDGAQASMCFTDPPYGVSLGDHGGQGQGRPKRRIANDALDPVAWEAFVRAWAGTLLARVEGAIYVCMGSKALPLLSRVLIEEGGHWSDTIIWAKDRFTLGRSDYQRAYEPIRYGWREGARHIWHGGRDEDDVWHIERPSASPLHPTTKPLALIERALENSSDAGALVLDPFLGSGSTLIACEAHRPDRCRPRARAPLLRCHRGPLGGLHRPDRGASRWLSPREARSLRGRDTRPVWR